MKLMIQRLILALSLLTAVLAPKAALADEQGGCLELKETWSDYNAAVKGTTTDVHLKFRSHGCHLAVNVPLSTLSLSTQTQTDFVVKMLSNTYRKVKKSEKSPTGHMADEMKLVVSVNMAGDLAPGNYTVPVVLDYQAIDDQGSLVQKSTTLVIPVKVVGSIQQRHFQEEPDPWKGLKIAGWVAVAVVALPAIVVLEVVGLITGHPIMTD